MKPIAIALFLISFPAAAQTILPAEPPPGQLRPGEVVYVQCGPGKARTVAGGSDRNSAGQLTGTGSKRQRGPCVRVN